MLGYCREELVEHGTRESCIRRRRNTNGSAARSTARSRNAARGRSRPAGGGRMEASSTSCSARLRWTWPTGPRGPRSPPWTSPSERKRRRPCRKAKPDLRHTWPSCCRRRSSKRMFGVGLSHSPTVPGSSSSGYTANRRFPPSTCSRRLPRRPRTSGAESYRRDWRGSRFPRTSTRRSARTGADIPRARAVQLPDRL